MERWHLPRTIYGHPATIKGLKNKPIQTIRSFIPVLLQLNGRTFYDTPLLEINLGNRRDFQLIIGLKFLAYYGIAFDCANIRLQIFKRMPKDPLWQKNIEISWNVLGNNKINAKAQKNVIRRNEK
jgi:hypothetical protein